MKLKFMPRVLFLVLLLPFLVTLKPLISYAHTSLKEAVPAPNSHLEASLNEIVLTFNEKLEENMCEIRLLNSKGEAVTDNQANLHSDQNKLVLQVPPLSDGMYTVTYKVVSLDGHTVQGSYGFTFGKADFSLSEGEAKSSQLSLEDAVYPIRVFYVISSLLLIGWILWGCFVRSDTESFKKFRRFMALLLQIIHLLGLLMIIILQTSGFAKENGDPIMIPIGAGFGLSWLVTLSLAFAGLFILQRSLKIDIAWMISLIAAKSFNGHALSADPVWSAVLVGFVHLAVAAVWGGGLFYILVCWKRFRLHMIALLPVFSKVAFVCMFGLWLTGILNVILYTTDVNELFASNWGRLLLIKVILVLCVTIFAAVMRLRILNKQQINDLAGWLAVDFGFMAAVAGIAAILSYVNPG